MAVTPAMIWIALTALAMIASSSPSGAGFGIFESASGLAGNGTSGLPEVDMIEVRERVCSGWSAATSLRDHAAHRDADDVGLLDPERVQESDRILRHVVERVRQRRGLAGDLRLDDRPRIEDSRFVELGGEAEPLNVAREKGNSVT